MKKRYTACQILVVFIHHLVKNRVTCYGVSGKWREGKGWRVHGRGLRDGRWTGCGVRGGMLRCGRVMSRREQGDIETWSTSNRQPIDLQSGWFFVGLDYFILQIHI